MHNFYKVYSFKFSFQSNLEVDGTKLGQSRWERILQSTKWKMFSTKRNLLHRFWTLMAWCRLQAYFYNNRKLIIKVIFSFETAEEFQVTFDKIPDYRIREEDVSDVVVTPS